VKKEIINKVISDFYELARNDFLIGYHFRHIDDFETHIPKIQRFWYLIFLDLTESERKEIVQQGIPKNVIQSHVYLKIKKGEVGRWVILFNQILDKYRHQDPEFISLWENEINKFYERFVNSKVLFG